MRRVKLMVNENKRKQKKCLTVDFQTPSRATPTQKAPRRSLETQCPKTRRIGSSCSVVGRDSQNRLEKERILEANSSRSSSSLPSLSPPSNPSPLLHGPRCCPCCSRGTALRSARIRPNSFSSPSFPPNDTPCSCPGSKTTSDQRHSSPPASRNSTEDGRSSRGLGSSRNCRRCASSSWTPWTGTGCCCASSSRLSQAFPCRSCSFLVGSLSGCG